MMTENLKRIFWATYLLGTALTEATEAAYRAGDVDKARLLNQELKKTIKMTDTYCHQLVAHGGLVWRR